MLCTEPGTLLDDLPANFAANSIDRDSDKGFLLTWHALLSMSAEGSLNPALPVMPVMSMFSVPFAEVRLRPREQWGAKSKAGMT